MLRGLKVPMENPADLLQSRHDPDVTYSIQGEGVRGASGGQPEENALDSSDPRAGAGGLRPQGGPGEGPTHELFADTGMGRAAGAPSLEWADHW